eukprot:COSAG02_NODE_20_length_53673_cov_86.864841_16_plen_231_part_00
MVTLDVNRIYPEEEFFASVSIRALLTDVLTIWALEHPYTEDTPEALGTPTAQSYRQGMHELLAPFVYVLENEKRPVPALPTRQDRAQEDADNEDAVYRCTDLGILRTQLDVDYTEHDAYLLFCKMMEAMHPVYAPVEPGHVVREAAQTRLATHPFMIKPTQSRSGYLLAGRGAADYHRSAATFSMGRHLTHSTYHWLWCAMLTSWLAIGSVQGKFTIHCSKITTSGCTNI